MNEDDILDHWQSPVGKPPGFPPTLSGFAENPVCGDTLRIDIRMANGIMEQVGFDGKGCVLSQAGGSMLVELMQGKNDDWLFAARCMTPEEQMEFVAKLYGGKPIPVRWGCCLLPLKALSNVKPFPVVE